MELSLIQLGNTEWTQNWTLGGLELHGEIRNDQTQEVWLCQQPISHEVFQELELPEGFSKALFGRGAHDAAYFPRPPEGNEDSPLPTMKVDNLTFSKVARADKVDMKYMKQGFRNLFLLTVYKYHIVLFKAGRTIDILTMEDGKDYVPNMAVSDKGITDLVQKEQMIPSDWSVRRITLQEDLILEIPNPARVCFFKNGYGFHGPVKI